MSKLHSWMHRKGIARVVNTESNSYNDKCSAMIDTRGPKWLGEFLWQYALRGSWKSTRASGYDVDSLVIANYWHLSSGGHRWKVTFRRA